MDRGILFDPLQRLSAVAVGGGQAQRGGLPGQMFLLAPRQLGFGPIDRLLPNQSRAEIG
jgi:hypothetical protein